MHFATLVNVCGPCNVDDALEPFASEPEDRYGEFYNKTNSNYFRRNSFVFLSVSLKNTFLI